MNKVQKIVIFILVFLTFITRLVTLSKVPPHLSNDEISIAYDSYSIRHTARDEHNNFLPVSFQSHNTYKAPLYVYLATITNYFLGNSEFSVRLPSAILGSLTVFVFGYIIFLLCKNINLSIISVGVLALTPWHIYTSRMALESNIAVFFLVTALLIFFNSIINNKNHLLMLSMIFFALSIWAYHTEWLLTPMIMFLLFYIYRKKIKLNTNFWLATLIFVILVFPIAYNAWINRGTTARANTEIIFNDPGISKIIKNSNISKLKKIMIVGESFFKNYSDYTKLGHLFFDGLPLLPKEDPYSVGLFFLPLLPFFLWGFFKIKLYFPNDYKFIYLWIIISPIVPSLTIGGTNMVRNLATVLPYSLLIGVGLYNVKNKINFFKLWILVLSIFISILYFLAIYFYHFPFQMGENFQYGYKQAAEYINDNYDKYDQIIVDPRFGNINIYVGVPHLYLAYFTNLDPKKMLLRSDSNKGLLFDKYHIFEINWNLEKILPRSLYLVPFDNQPGNNFNNLRTVKEIKLPNYKVEFKLLESTN
ncbi:MAG: glycosyltransferase family 39 protein [Candidatus Shapirobacteria bacterium]|nr:glycosyltransferase family 39 protein [Candidatus Shapirobacteria bacterium]